MALGARRAAIGAELALIHRAARAGPLVAGRLGLAALGAELAGVAGVSAGAGPACGLGRRRLGGLLLTHGVQVLCIHAAGLTRHVHAHERHGRAALVGRRHLHGVALTAHQMGGSAGGIHEGRVPLQLLDHLLVFFAGFDAGHAEGDDFDAAQLAPLAGQLLIQSLGQLGGMAGQSRVADAHLADAGEGGLQCGHHLGAHLGVYSVPGVAVGDVAAHVLVEQHGVGYLIGIFAEALYGYLKLQPRAYVVVDHPEGDRVGGAVLVADYLLGVEVIDALITEDQAEKILTSAKEDFKEEKEQHEKTIENYQKLIRKLESDYQSYKARMKQFINGQMDILDNPVYEMEFEIAGCEQTDGDEEDEQQKQFGNEQ